MPVSNAIAKANGFDIEPPIKQMKMKLKETAQQWSKTVQSVPSIPTGNKMLLLSAEEDD